MLQNSKRIGFLLLDNFSMIAFSNMLEVLRMANYVIEDNLYQWNVTGLDGHHSCASNGLQIQHTCVLSHLLNMDIVFICGGFQLYKNMTPRLKNFLYQLDQKKIALGGLCTGAYVLAKAGLLNGFRASMHWENTLAAQEEFPLVQFTTYFYY
jgi:transcriptional regulator GlxA family with amidase domain